MKNKLLVILCFTVFIQLAKGAEIDDSGFIKLLTKKFYQTGPDLKMNPGDAQDQKLTAPLFEYVSNMSLTSVKGYYGTVIFYDATDTDCYILTAAHLLPRDKSLWNQLRTVVDDRKVPSVTVPLRVIGYSRGYDIAVLAVKRSLMPDPDFTKYTTRDLKRDFEQVFDKTSIHNSPVRLSIIGVEGFADPLTSNGLTWNREVQFKVQPTSPSQMMPLLSEPIDLRVRNRCGPLFLKTCYAVPIRTWGFSGGALVVEQQDGKKTAKITGIVTHYETLSQVTYATPIAKAIEIANRLREKAALYGEGYEDTVDETETLRYVSQNTVDILKGDLAGYRASSQFYPKVGGGLVEGGEPKGGGFTEGGEPKGGGFAEGGEPKGGGGFTPGGEPKGGGFTQGGEPKGGGGTYSVALDPWELDEIGDTFFFTKYDSFKNSSKHPERWGTPQDTFIGDLSLVQSFKGIDAIVSDETGIALSKDGKGTTHYYQYERRPLIDIRSFVREYQGMNSFSKLERHWQERTFPQELNLRPTDEAGIRTLALVYNWKEEQYPAKKLSTSADEYFSLLSKTRQKYFLKNPEALKLDTLLVPIASGLLAPVTQARVLTYPDFVCIDFYSQFGKLGSGWERMTTEGPWKQKGDYLLEFRGNYKTSNFNDKKETQQSGMIRLEYDEVQKNYELTLVTAMELDGPSHLPYTDGTMVAIEGLHLRLKPYDENSHIDRSSKIEEYAQQVDQSEKKIREYEIAANQIADPEQRRQTMAQLTQAKENLAKIKAELQSTKEKERKLTELEKAIK